MLFNGMVILTLLFVLCSCHRINLFFGMKDDNVIEEMVEKVIKEKTDLDLDLTPKSPEEKDEGKTEGKS